uniref:Secreted RxLR effector protein 10 n=1 Tax=Plasmopara viticola TaxID=143451 RepID=RLR10_PLAVT|nr:RecName: Full=Secreted RxLR effector protein 10; Flags: Precursor [Plasmopara viticola]ANC73370.1 secreted RxLR effector peptide protein 10 [Plasmopara viticola]
MRVLNFVLTTTVVLLTSSEGIASSPQVRHIKPNVAIDHLSIRSLRATENPGSDESRLNEKDTGFDPDGSSSKEDEDIGEPTFWEKVRFRYWKTMGKTPGDLRKEYFEGMDEAVIKNNPNYKLVQQYEVYYDEKSSE